MCSGDNVEYFIRPVRLGLSKQETLDTLLPSLCEHDMPSLDDEVTCKPGDRIRMPQTVYTL